MLDGPDVVAHVQQLPQLVDALSRRRACDVPEQTIDRLVALRWLRWSAGSLRLTEAGEAKVVALHAAALGDQLLAACAAPRAVDQQAAASVDGCALPLRRSPMPTASAPRPSSANDEGSGTADTSNLKPASENGAPP